MTIRWYQTPNRAVSSVNHASSCYGCVSCQILYLTESGEVVGQQNSRETAENPAPNHNASGQWSEGEFLSYRRC